MMVGRLLPEDRAAVFTLVESFTIIVDIFYLGTFLQA